MSQAINAVGRPAAGRGRGAPRTLCRLATPLVLLAGTASAQDLVHVVLDMDAHTPGFQPRLVVPAGTTHVAGLSVHVYAAAGQPEVYTIGYAGGIDRGISLGHMPDNLAVGSVVALLPQAGTPVNPGNTAWPYTGIFIDRAFGGPEVQYIEHGARQPAVVPPAPGVAIFSAGVLIESPQACDAYAFYLSDFVSLWMPGHGAFSTLAPNSLDTGGDSFPDDTLTIYGVDADAGVPVPPAAFLVDYIDGPATGGPATLVIAPVGDLNLDLHVDQADLGLLLADFGCEAGVGLCPGDVNGDGRTDQADLGLLLAHFGTACP